VTSFLQDKGVPGIVERTLIRPPSSQLGPIDPARRAETIAQSPLRGKYDQTIDRDSAYERLRARAADATAMAQPLTDRAAGPSAEDGLTHARRYGGQVARPATDRVTAGRSDSIGTAFAKSFARQLGSRTGQAVVRGILGSLFRSR
jgi:hypothetical protein